MAACFSRVPERTRTAYAYDRCVRSKRPSSPWIRSAARRGLELAALRAEGVAAPSPYYLENTGVFIHRMDPAAVQTAAEPLARTVRIRIITPPGALTRDAQKQLVKDATGIMADICGDPSLANARGCF